ncbi:glyoxylate/hydroxypyruvate reductase A-like isoform X2 [Symsagittifera roscoffensis]|uniref:glyoxylate/hydroxypyruvate reductase A-like isoform X2 n=1 Tax=Symsagittifera roscoffensis TaxID=84072 RepID=UPI00307C1BBC
MLSSGGSTLVRSAFASSEILVADGTEVAEFAGQLIGSNVQWIHSSTSGVNKLMENEHFKEFVRMRGDDMPLVTRTSLARPMAAYCLAHMFSYYHRLPQYSQLQREKEWKQISVRPIEEVTVGFLGVGDIGGEVAAACKRLGMRCIGYSASTTAKQNFAQIYTGDVESVLRQSDFLVNSLPHTPHTVDLLSSGTLEVAAANSPVFINVGRGSVIDEDSILEALDKGWIRQAILDVFETEPLPQTSKLWDHPSVTITPHSSNGSIDEMYYVPALENFVQNLQLIKEGKSPALIVDYSKGY